MIPEIENMYTLRLELYFDDFQTASPISHNASKHKIAGFYFTLNNLPYYTQSKRKNILLCLVAHRSTIDKARVNTVLKPMIEELKILWEGVDMGLDKPVRGYLAAVIGDNLATNELANISRNFTTAACKFCTITYRQIQDVQNCIQYPGENRQRDNMVEYRNYSGAIPIQHSFLEISKIFIPFTFDIFHDLHEGNLLFASVTSFVLISFYYFSNKDA